MSDNTPMPAGWYHGDGDPVGTQRYWDGEMWQGEPQLVGASSATTTSSGGAAVAGMPVSNEWKRIGARVIDVIIGAIIGFVLSLIGIGASGFDFSGDTEDVNMAFIGALGLITVVVSLLWDALFVGLLGGTPGKLLLGMRVVDAETGATPPGLKFGFMRALNRLLAILSIIGSLIGAVIGIVSLIFLFTDDRKRTVMDRVANTVVVDVK